MMRLYNRKFDIIVKKYLINQFFENILNQIKLYNKMLKVKKKLY